jgi:4-amino-4-deoxy-L-arabinose transferase-like glycosyltransferase
MIGMSGITRVASGLLLVAGVLATLIIGARVFFSSVGKNPAGLFCDEAQIGVRMRDLVKGNLGWFPPPLFYHHLEYDHLGALPLYFGAPFVAVLGLSDFSVRLVNVFWSVMAILLLILMVRRMKWRYGELAVIAFAFTPIYIHLARIQFGHGPSVFCVSAGLYCWVRSHQTGSARWGVGSGLLIGASMYGAPSYYIAAPLILGALILGDVVVRRLDWRAYRPTLFAALGFAITVAGVVIKALTDDKFIRRFREKQGAARSEPVTDRLSDILHSFGKYFDSDYLFRVGETGLPGGWNMRHSVPGAGELTWIVLPIVVAGIVAIFRIKDSLTKALGVAGLVILLLFPLPDAITTTSKNPPYSVSVFSMLIFIPILGAIGMHWLSGLFAGRSFSVYWREWILPIGTLAIVLIGAWNFWDGPYRNYPNVSYGYYGWQFGSSQAFDAFKEHPGYDRYIFDGDFNAAYIFRDFYLADDPALRAKTLTGWPTRLADGKHRDLYAVRAERADRIFHSQDSMRRYMKLIDVIYYPDGTVAMFLIEYDPSEPHYEGQLPR